MQFQEGQTVGIDLGTTFSAIAHLDEDGNPVVVPNEDDQLVTPSLIVRAQKGHVLVGPNRMRAAMEDPDNVVERVKRYMGNADFRRVFDGREITPEFLSALILKKLKQYAEKRIGKIGNAVITVPYYFNDVRRKATEDAGRIAGLNVVDIINEPTAATLTYAWYRNELGAKSLDMRSKDNVFRQVLVYDLGGGTFDVTLVRYTPTHFQVLATDGDVHLGGLDWNERLVDLVAEEFQTRHGVDVRESSATLQMLRYDCDQAKISLSESLQTIITCRHKGRTVSVPVSRKRFNEITADLVRRTLDTADLVLQQAKLEPQDLDALVLVGGSTAMPQVREALEGFFGQKAFLGLSSETSVAQGAAIHGAILEIKHCDGQTKMAEKLRGKLGVIQQEEVNSHGLGIAVKSPKSGKMVNHVMISRNTRLPVEKKQKFATNVPSQQRVSITVVEGDAPDPAACSLLGKCRITDLPEALPKGSPIEVTYAFNQSGRVTVSARDMIGGQSATIKIERRGRLNDRNVDDLAKLMANYCVE